MYISMDDVEDKFEAILVATGDERMVKLNAVCDLLGMTTKDDALRYIEDSGVYIGGDEDGK